MKEIQRRWLWLGASAIVLGLAFYHLSHSSEWRAFRWDRFWSSLVHARPGFLLAALAATYLSYLMRAYRWKLFLDPIKKASLWVLFVGQILGFSSIYLIGRPGEFVRPAYIAKKEHVPITSMVAVWLLERIYDTVFVVLLFAAALYLVPLHPTTPHAASVLATMHRGGLAIFLITALMIVALVVFRLGAEKLAAWLPGVFPFLPPRARERLEHFLRSFSQGLEVIRNWRDLLASVASSAVLWIVNTSVLWLVFRSLGGELEQLSWMAAALVLFCAALGLMVQLPGIGGGYQVATILALTEFFEVGTEAATGAAILIWIIISVPCLALAFVLLVHEGLTFKKLEAIAEEERAAMAESQTGVRN